MDKDNRTREEIAAEKAEMKQQKKALKQQAREEKKRLAEQAKEAKAKARVDKTKNAKTKDVKAKDVKAKAIKAKVKKPKPEKPVMPDKKKKYSRTRAFFNRLNTKRNRVIAIIIVAIILLLIVNSIVKARKEKLAVFEISPQYTTASLGDIEVTISGDGNLESGSSIAFTAKTDIAIEKVTIQEGQEVKTGDVIATLDADAMKEIMATVEYDLNAMQATVDESDKVEDTYYIKAPCDGRLKDVQVEEDDLVEDAMTNPGYIALISTAGEMKMEITEEQYEELSKVGTLVVKSEGTKYKEDVELRMIDGKPYVILPDDFRTIGATARVYSAEATKEGNELATGTLELVAYEKLLGTYGEISYQDDFENYSVEKGEVLFHVDKYKYTLANSYFQLDELRNEYTFCKELYDTLTLTAPSDGIITDIMLADDTTVAQDSAIATIQSTDDWKATIAVDELDISTIEVGQSAVITIDALDYEEVPATVKSISSAGTASGGITTYDVVLEVEDNDNFRISMTVTCEIVTQSAKDAVTVSSTAIRTSGTTSYVMVATERTVEEKAKIKKAILNNDYEALMEFIDTTGTSDTASGGQRPEGFEEGEMPEGFEEGEMPEGFDESSMPQADEMAGQNQMSSQMMIFALSDPVELLYAEVRIVEVGLDDGTIAQIISGLEEGESILLPTSTDTDSESDAFSMGMMGGGGGGTRPEGGGEGGGGEGGAPPS